MRPGEGSVSLNLPPLRLQWLEEARAGSGMALHRLPIFDGLRGIAAISVMLYHADVIFAISTPFSRGYLFVDFFFLLSGFVLTLSVEPRMRDREAAAAFMIARVKRLWPLTAIGALVGVGAGLSMDLQESVPLSLILALLMIPAFQGQGELFPLNGPQWSLFLELLANAVHAFVLRRLDERQLRVIVLVSALALAVTIMRFGSNMVGPRASNWPWAIPRVAFSYVLGVWFARKWSAGPRTVALPWALALILPVAYVIALPVLPMTLGISDMLATIVLLPAFFWVAASAQVPPGAELWLSRLGAISFPLYAVHLPILRMVAYKNSDLLMMLIAIAGAFVAALLLERISAAFLAKARGGHHQTAFAAQVA